MKYIKTTCDLYYKKSDVETFEDDLGLGANCPLGKDGCSGTCDVDIVEELPKGAILGHQAGILGYSIAEMEA